MMSFVVFIQYDDDNDQTEIDTSTHLIKEVPGQGYARFKESNRENECNRQNATSTKTSS